MQTLNLYYIYYTKYNNYIITMNFKVVLSQFSAPLQCLLQFTPVDSVVQRVQRFSEEQ